MLALLSQKPCSQKNSTDLQQVDRVACRACGEVAWNNAFFGKSSARIGMKG